MIGADAVAKYVNAYLNMRLVMDTSDSLLCASMLTSPLAMMFLNWSLPPMEQSSSAGTLVYLLHYFSQHIVTFCVHRRCHVIRCLLVSPQLLRLSSNMGSAAQLYDRSCPCLTSSLGVQDTGNNIKLPSPLPQIPELIRKVNSGVRSCDIIMSAC